MKLKVIVTGVTGMVGEGVLHECILDDAISEILVVGRRSSGIKNTKLKEIVVADMFDLSALKGNMMGIDACFFCLGVSSVGMKEDQYTKLTYDLTMNFAQELSKQSPEAVFCYVSGASTDSTEQGRSMWARVKGKTENALLKLFPRGYMFRPGYMHPTPGLKNVNKAYKYLAWLYPFFRHVLGKGSTLAELGQAMIKSVTKGYDKKILEVKDIIALAKK
jgi:uncharacterized protein YbjT (DUF2867 family)